ncbi:hypothetical protein NPIL_607911 [Nephila pilipes]|uniref:Uncharacterized protein n=1 Tax=Nephila pilipes TaxID=299642 RepID=A0A8X6NI66_NEPPI|nr:hypothetical protein NPIL_607911 [Nephila pilipes]
MVFLTQPVSQSNRSKGFTTNCWTKKNRETRISIDDDINGPTAQRFSCHSYGLNDDRAQSATHASIGEGAGGAVSTRIGYTVNGIEHLPRAGLIRGDLEHTHLERRGDSLTSKTLEIGSEAEVL